MPKISKNYIIHQKLLLGNSWADMADRVRIVRGHGAVLFFMFFLVFGFFHVMCHIHPCTKPLETLVQTSVLRQSKVQSCVGFRTTLKCLCICEKGLMHVRVREFDCVWCSLETHRHALQASQEFKGWVGVSWPHPHSLACIKRVLLCAF